MRFIDANVFIYAFLRPKKEPPENVKEIKERAKAILTRVSDGEHVVTTVVHLSEVANVVESRGGKKKAVEVVLAVLTSENIEVLPVSPSDYLKATLIAEEKNLGVNDALAYVKMKELDIEEIYTFDRDFEKLDVRVVKV
ncbi:type II toxin-antitoxin system VapC family toxin [Thermococcus nautili]|uniref:Ribonuclease VapC n=1 Tax=Thermococcus nautili TaxID=195522 RepID=W8P102_9EURY|nr:type II toxin-antitoxin system VapC family toxin [Thermococcus nautili]AHL22411.1 putative nucleic acid-binding protein, contains PIN domain [Thermococcus nautili]CAI1493543.1 Ribonuclease VapC [Thermococcus nautili]